MLKTSNEKANTLEWRELNLKLTKLCLEKYKLTGDEDYLEWTKIFGEWSRKIKNNYLDKLK